MQLTCRKCGHVHAAATGAPDEACPNCGAIYARVTAAMEKQRLALRKTRLKSIAKEEPPRRWLTPVVAKFVYGFVLLIMAVGTAISVASGNFNLVLIGSLLTFAVVGWIMVEAVLVLFVISEDAAHIRRHLAVLRARAEADDDAG